MTAGLDYVRTLSSLPQIDYADFFSLDAELAATPEQWARAMFGDVPSLAEQVIWRGALGLRLSPERSPDTVGGWRVAGRGADWLRLEAASWLLSGNLVIVVVDQGVSLGTFIHYERRLTGAWWTPLSALHRFLVPRVLRDARARLERRAGSQRRN